VPRTRPLIVATALFLGAAAVFSVPPQAAVTKQEAKENLQALKERIKALQQELDKSETSKSHAADALRDSEHAISDANRKLHELAARSRAASDRLAQLKKQSAKIEHAVHHQQQQLAALLYARYLDGNPGALQLLLNGRNPDEIARALYYLGYVSRAESDLIGKLRGNLDRLHALTAAATKEADEIAALKAEQVTETRALEHEKKKRAAVLAKVSKKITAQRQQLTTFQHNEERLAQLVERLNRIIAKARPQAAPPPPPKSGVYNNKLPSAAFDNSTFQQLKGRLHLPVRGELLERFGSPRSEGDLTWKGLFIAARTGEPVKAIAAGRVVFADWLRGFGNLLIIDHGGGYMSLYGDNETLYKQVGDVVHAGDTIAAVGDTGGNPRSGLYFEIRYKGKPFDPLTWISLK
jgi:septal ring factor EnvC (AmiA/AmiB activator)